MCGQMDRRHVNHRKSRGRTANSIIDGLKDYNADEFIADVETLTEAI